MMMRTKKVNRYYCDFCKKAGCSAGHMRKHEAACTNNPNRVCGMCKISEKAQKPIWELLEASLCGIDKLREVADGCPACMMAGIRQHPRDTMTDGLMESMSEFSFDKESKEFWKPVNEQQEFYGYAGD